MRLSQQGAYVWRCLRRFASLRKTAPLKFWSMYLMCFIDCCCFLLDFISFAGFRISQLDVCVGRLPEALRRPQKKHAPGLFGVILIVVVRFGFLFAALSLPAGCVFSGCLALWRPQRKHSPGVFGTCICCDLTSSMKKQHKTTNHRNSC